MSLRQYFFTLHSPPTKGVWPNQNRPHEKSWAEWRTAIKDAFVGPPVFRANKARSSQPLATPLGPWIGTRHRSQRLWSHYVSGTTGTLYIRRHRGFRCHDKIPATFRQRRFQVEYSSALHTLTTVAIATPVSCTPGRHSLDTSITPDPPFTHAETDPARPAPATLRERIQQLEPWQAPLLDYVESIQAENRLHYLLTQARSVSIELASDGGA
jgi:hypothetical protein